VGSPWPGTIFAFNSSSSIHSASVTAVSNRRLQVRSFTHLTLVADLFLYRQPREPRLRESSASKATIVTPQSRSARIQQRSSLAADEDDIKDRTSSLRRRVTDAQATPDIHLTGNRQSRTSKPAQMTDFDRRSSRISNQVDYDEDSEEADSENMASDDDKDETPTYDKEYVETHPNERFYHTGNGWYKRGRRPPGRKQAKNRDAQGHAVKRRADGSFAFAPKTTIHVSQLESYPGVEFHHCGNGWYRAGPDASGLRASRYGGGLDDDIKAEDEDDDDVRQMDGEGEEAAEEEDDDDGGEDLNATVSKAYTRKHPEIEWQHRGKGRYMRKSVVQALKSVTPASASIEPERDQTIYSKAYVEAHPEIQFHHRGNAKYMRGPPPERWAANRRKKTAQAVVSAEEEEEEVEDDTKLFSKAFVDAHPELEFHHRGQGRYARGPRRASNIAPVDYDEGEEEAPDGLVDTDYVNSHPNETFHHRGQGRWARGLPGPGASRKTAIRGPGARSQSYGEGEDAAEEEQEAEGLPHISALVQRAEGPDMFPQYTWNYRGGGKWSRLTKQQYEDMQKEMLKAAAAEHKRAKARKKNRRGSGADAETGDAGNDVGEDGAASAKPPIKRRRVNKRGSYLAQENGTGTKPSSNGQSKAPTPKPRMLEPEEDILTAEDLPELYRDDWSPPSEFIADPYERMARGMRPMNSPDKFVKALTKHDPAARSLDNLKQLAANSQNALDQLQREYLDLDKITAPHARIPRKVAKGGRVPVDEQIFEDKKEADLYDYNYDPRRLGYQDPQAQKIQRDADGRELRNRRQRHTQLSGTIPGWNFGEEEITAGRRAVKPVNRFDGIVEPLRKRARNSTTGTGLTSKAPSMTPDRGSTPLGGPIRTSIGTGTRGRLMGNVPRRIQELRGDSVGGLVGGREGTPNSARKGRPPGSKNLHKRKDAGIKKGPRKPKMVDGLIVSGNYEGIDGFGGEGEGEGEGL